MLSVRFVEHKDRYSTVILTLIQRNGEIMLATWQKKHGSGNYRSNNECGDVVISMLQKYVYEQLEKIKNEDTENLLLEKIASGLVREYRMTGSRNTTLAKHIMKLIDEKETE